ncbi:histidine phosphatase family protein [Shewanella cyperi]|uniref:Histidine phosphatase family protein n=1 Tax=Shewanella cyperi TaxID=2814292 RepID=A0A975AKR9_9GAMM|nr:histidine phosphatase family protein [Shewanella cyperi]QSX30450.1 histidine phosphatase family protein [Shewanella cyperi]
MLQEIYILRHGQTEFNADGKLQGHCNSPLTDLGRAQARAYGKTLANPPCDTAGFQLLSSPLGRAMETAALVAAELGLATTAITQEPRLMEAGLGEWEMARIADIHAAHPVLAGRNDWYLQAPGAETLTAIRARLLDWLQDPATPERVIIVSHGITTVVFRGLLLGLDDSAMWRQDKPQDAFYHFANGAMARIGC